MVRLEGLKTVNALIGQNTSKDPNNKGKLRLDLGKILVAYLTAGSGSGATAAQGAQGATTVGTTATNATAAGKAVTAAEAAKTATLAESVAAAESTYVAKAATAATESSLLSNTLQQVGKYKQMIQGAPSSLLGGALDAGIEATSGDGLVNDTLNEVFKLLKTGADNYTPPPKQRRR